MIISSVLALEANPPAPGGAGGTHHVQGIRSFMDKNLRPEEWRFPTVVRWTEVLAPGLLMTPVSSVLEASNAGHSNPEPLVRRWTRGVMWRGMREIIFAAGLNQVSGCAQQCGGGAGGGRW